MNALMNAFSLATIIESALTFSNQLLLYHSRKMFSSKGKKCVMMKLILIKPIQSLSASMLIIRVVDVSSARGLWSFCILNMFGFGD